MHNQGLRQLFLTVSWDLHGWHSTTGGVLVSIQFWKQCTGRIEGPLRAQRQLKQPVKGPIRTLGSCLDRRVH